MVDVEKFKEEQFRAARKVLVRDDFKKIETIAGCYQAFDEHKVVSAIVVCNRKFEILEKECAVTESRLPYMSGFRYFREGPAIASAFAKLKKPPHVMIVSGNGILHPLRIGLASHIGVILKIPTIGIAKLLMCGEKEEGGRIYFHGEVRGQELMTRHHSNPLYISPGHRISLETSVEIVNSMMKHPHKFPEPLHLARRLAKSSILS